MPRNEDFVKGIITSFSNCKGVALDIGANHGLYTKIMSPRFADVYAFEPHPDNVKKLEENVIPYPNVVVVPMGVGTEDGTMTLYINQHNEGGHSIQKGLAETGTWGHSLENKIEVGCVTLDTYCKDMDVKLIKCDIEGGEYDIFYQAENTLLNNELILILETHQVKDFESDQKKRNELLEYLNDLSIKCFNYNREEVSKLDFDTHYLCTNMDLKWK
tara:strand:- start:20638 stop:21285 length:648 start_codon:yes stop_codon:yes gene_type:complete